MIQKRVTKHVEFSAAHSIQGAGKCANKHGHNWVATITVDQMSGDLDERGFIIDVRDLKDTAFKYDHDDLDKYFEWASTENIAQKIAEDSLELCKANNPHAMFVINVHLAETTHNSADVSATNWMHEGLGDPASTKWANLGQLKKNALDAEAAYEAGFGQTPAAKFIKRSK